MADAHNLPYIVEYDKSGRSKCQHCNKAIDKDHLRLGIMIKSKSNKGTNARWYHEYCFFLKAKPNKITSISGFINLENSDQHRLLLKIRNSAEKNKNGRKRPAEDYDFRIEYAKSGSSKCEACLVNIEDSDIQVCKTTEGTELWYHLSCFAKNKFDLLYFDYGKDLEGMDKLKKEDQESVKKKLEEVTLGSLPWKSAKYSDQETEDIMKYKNQNILFHKCLSKLEKLKDVDLKNLLTFNMQTVPKSRHERLLILGDMMAFGALQLCPKCTKGQLVVDTNGYKCSGKTPGNTACSYVIQDPAKKKMKVPAKYKKLPCFKDYKPTMTSRLFLTDDVLNINKNVVARPLKNLKFLVIKEVLDGGDKVSNEIKKLGGICLKSLHSRKGEPTAIVYPVELFNDLDRLIDGVADAEGDYDNINKICNLEYFEDYNIDVVDPSFLDKIDRIKGTVAESAKIILESDYSGWGGDKERMAEHIADSYDRKKYEQKDKKKDDYGNEDDDDENEDDDDENEDDDDESEDDDDESEDEDDESEDDDD